MAEQNKRLSTRERERAFLEDAIAQLKKMSPQEAREISIRAGIVDDSGKLTKEYGGNADRSERYVPIEMTA